MLYLYMGGTAKDKQVLANDIAQQMEQRLYQIDLSSVISKYIGETEKNLANLFIKAEKKNYILFFDEADALFGKRSSIKDAHDRYANQETNYLLSYLERYSGIVILSTNMVYTLPEENTQKFQFIKKFDSKPVRSRSIS